ncbi:oxidoreductase [Rhodoflexus caldus]|uniref:oxidoreductase n=1 Tax=Rhodoflexus caldus TaxID=2891236 RepID=UPI00202A06F5|nr:oxidoreductase [Rhodoflexus caldus]
MKVLIAGATGLIGSHLLRQSLQNPAIMHVVPLVRKPMQISHPKLQEIIFNFDNPQDYDNLPVVDAAFCCLGTTIKKAGSREAFRKVDYDYPLALAKAMRDKGTAHFLVVTALGSDARSMVFYSRVKGELEEALIGLQFPSLSIFQPSLLLGERKEKRFGEDFAKWLMPLVTPLLAGSLRKYRAIHGADVAKAMLKIAMQPASGVCRYPSDEIQEIADHFRI